MAFSGSQTTALQPFGAPGRTRSFSAKTETTVTLGLVCAAISVVPAVAGTPSTQPAAAGTPSTSPAVDGTPSLLDC